MVLSGFSLFTEVRYLTHRVTYIHPCIRAFVQVSSVGVLSISTLRTRAPFQKESPAVWSYRQNSMRRPCESNQVITSTKPVATKPSQSHPSARAQPVV
jgi:hypothetical protein